MDGKTLVLDSAPSVSMEIPSHIQFHPQAPYTRKSRGQPILGQHQMKYTHFVPLHDSSEQIKKLLEIPESITSPSKPIEGYKEILKAEKEDADHGKPVAVSDLVDSDFKKEATHYMNAPKTDNLETYESKVQEESAPVIEKNDAALATVIAVTQPKSKPKVKAKPKPKPKSKLKKKIQKKAQKKGKPKKMTSFRITKKKM